MPRLWQKVDTTVAAKQATAPIAPHYPNPWSCCTPAWKTNKHEDFQKQTQFKIRKQLASKMQIIKEKWVK